MALPIHSAAFSDSLVVLGTAGLVIPAFARFKITPVIGFILVGMLVGPQGLGRLVDDVPWLYHVTISDRHSIEPFAEFGIVLLLFSIGLELSFRRLWGMRRTVFGLGTSKLVLAALEMASRARSVFCIHPLQDYLALGGRTAMSGADKRINQPGLVDEKNWRLRMPFFLEELKKLPFNKTLRALHKKTGRT